MESHVNPETAVVPDSTDLGTLRPDLPPSKTTGHHYEPMKIIPFDPEVQLPADVANDDPLAIWQLFFTPEMVSSICKATNK